jgi:hypothetical protein
MRIRGMQRIAISATVLLALLVPSAAGAAGGALLAADERAGVLSADGSARFVTLHGSSSSTVVARLALPGAEVERVRSVRGFFSIPAVAYDGTGGGLSPDGRTLVLIESPRRFPVRTTRIVALDAGDLRVERDVRLRGQFGFDAISPDGSKLYVVHYLSQRDPTRYAVRALSVATGKLDAPIVDPREPDEKMTGLPLTRATSPAGRWAYTLYDGTEHPFIHALDTVRGRAFCIDLDMLTARKDLPDLRLRVDRSGGTLSVVKGEKRIVLVDTKTMAARKPAATRPRGPAPTTNDAGEDPWLLTLLVGAALLLATAGVLVVRSRRLAGGTRAR